MKVTYVINLRDYDIGEYVRNPIVIASFDYSSFPLGFATVSTDRASVTVDYPDGGVYTKTWARVPHKLVEAYSDFGDQRLLLALSVVPKSGDSAMLK